MNLEQVAKVAAGEAIRQQVDIQGLIDLLRAYDYAHSVAATGQPKVYDVNILAQYVEPSKNRNGFRVTPVTFQNGGSSANPQDIANLMNKLMEHIPLVEIMSVILRDGFIRMWIKEFLWVHPFIDGNGRVGWILYNWLRGSLDSPVPLPDFFGEVE